MKLKLTMMMMMSKINQPSAYISLFSPLSFITFNTDSFSFYFITNLIISHKCTILSLFFIFCSLYLFLLSFLRDMIFELDESFEIRKSLIDLTAVTSNSNTNDNYNNSNNPPKQTSPPSRLTAAGILYLTILLPSIYYFYRYQYYIFIIPSSLVVPPYSIFINILSLFFSVC